MKDNVLQFERPNDDVQSWIEAGAGICPFCRGNKLKEDHRRIYDLRCKDCGHEFDMQIGELALATERLF